MLSEIEDFYQTTDGNDWSPAIERAQVNFHATNDPADPRGFTLLFRPREYHFSSSIQLIRGMNLTGSGGQSFAGTRLLFPAGVSGIICHRPATAPVSTPGRGDSSIVECMQIIATGKTQTAAHGVVMFAPMALRDVYIEGFGGDGIHIQAGASERSGTNADAWQIYNCRVELCSGNGLFLQGSDANAGCAIGLQCSDNGGWAIRDISQVGNTFIACLSHENGRDQNGNPLVPRLAFQAVAPDASSPIPRSLFLNCYSEGHSEIDAPNIVLGGYMEIKGNAVWLAPHDLANFPNGVRGYSPAASTFLNPTTKRMVSCSLGTGEQIPAALEFLAYDEQGQPIAAPYQLIYELWQAGWWELSFARLSGSTPLRFSTQAAAEGDSQLWLEQGFYIGLIERGERVRVRTGSSPPVTGAWQKGDRILNVDPVPGNSVKGFAGWICVASGTPGTWKAFGRIQS